MRTWSCGVECVCFIGWIVVHKDVFYLFVLRMGN